MATSVCYADVCKQQISLLSRREILSLKENELCAHNPTLAYPTLPNPTFDEENDCNCCCRRCFCQLEEYKFPLLLLLHAHALEC